MKIRYPEYFRVKCYNGISVRLWILLHTLTNTKKHFWHHSRGTVIVLSSSLVHPCIPYFTFLFFISFPMEQPTIQQLPTPKGEFLEPPQCSKPIIASNYEFYPGFIAMIREQTFSGLDYENPNHHLWVFEQLCACLTISGMTQETLRWKLFPFSLNERAK